jgi:hypothetical protein
LRELVSAHLPSRVREIDHYRGFPHEPGLPVPPIEPTPHPVA